MKSIKHFLVFCFAITLACCVQLRAQTYLENFQEVTEFSNLGDISLFAGRTLADGWALWKTDGTKRGTVIVKDLFDYGPGNFHVFNGELYFAANTENGGVELWKSDGTEEGTFLIKDLNANGSSWPSNFTEYNGLLYFIATSSFTTNGPRQIFKTDGTVEGTVLADELNLISNLREVDNLVVNNGKLYFYATTSALFETDGTSEGTESRVIDGLQYLSRFKSINNALYFITRNYNNTVVRLYRLNTLQDYVLLQEYVTEARNGYNFYGLSEAGDNAFFALGSGEAYNNVRDALWTTDGTPEGTVELVSFQNSNLFDSGNFTGFTAYNGKLYFNSGGYNDNVLWSSDGTVSGTAKVTAESGVNTVNEYSPMFVANGKLYFYNNASLQLISYSDQTNEFVNESILYTGRRTTGDTYFLNKDDTTVYFLAENRQGPYYSLDLYTIEPSPLMEVRISRLVQNGESVPLRTKVDSLITGKVEITNRGRAPLHFSKVFVSGEGFYVNGAVEGNFYQHGPNAFFPQMINPSERAVFELAFLPGSVGVHEGYLMIRGNDVRDPEFRIELDGLALEEPALETTATIPLDKEILWSTIDNTISIDNSAVPKRVPEGTLVGNLSTSIAEEDVEFALVQGTGSENNTDFSISDNRLLVGDGFNANLANSYAIRVKATAPSGAEVEEVLIIGTTEESIEVDFEDCQKIGIPLTSDLYDVAFINDTDAIAVGGSGVILKTNDKGANWRQVQIVESTNLVSGLYPNASRLYQVDFVNELVGFILGEAVLLRTDDGGENWIPLDLNSVPQYGTIGFKALSEDILLAIIGGRIHKSVDGGQSWYSSSGTGLPSFGDHRAFYFVDENFGIASTSHENYAITNDGGESWTAYDNRDVVENLNFDEDFTSFYFLNTTIGFAATSRGKFLKTEDGGSTWWVINDEYRSSVQGIYFYDENRGFIWGGTLYETDDGGVTWSSADLSVCTGIYGVDVNALGETIAVGGGCYYGNGRSVFTNSGGGEWIEQSQVAGRGDIRKILFDTDNVYFFSEFESRRSGDGGITWEEMITPIDDEVVEAELLGASLLIKDSNGFNEGFYRSEDQGSTWMSLDSGNMYGTFDVVGDNTIIAVNAEQGFSISRDSGDTWNVISTNVSAEKFVIEFVDETYGFTGGFPGISKTIDGGATWQEIDLGFESAPLVYEISFVTRDVGIISTTEGYFKTMDGGDSWELVPLIATNSRNILAVSLNEWYIAARNTIYSSTDGGSTWNTYFTANGEILDLKINNGVLYASNNDGIIDKVIDDIAPLNAGYIKGDTTVFIGDEVIYSVLKHSDTRFSWVVEGNNELISQDNMCRVNWKEPGTYVLRATPYSSCTVGLPSEITVQVINKPNPPEINGPIEVIENSTNTVYSTSLVPNTRYLWSAEGAISITANKNELSVEWGAMGVGEIGLITTDEVTGMRLHASLEVTVLPEDPFILTHTDATCIGKNNGTLGIVSRLSGVDYTMDLIYNNTTTSYSFTNELEVEGLAPGAYEFCIVESNANNPYCYGFIISEPEAFEVESKTGSFLTKEVNLKFRGGQPPYTVSLNGRKIAETSQKEITLRAENGDVLEVFASGDCNFSYAETLRFETIVTLAPNPVTDTFSVVLDTQTLQKGVNALPVKLYNLAGQIVFDKVIPIANNGVSCDISVLPSGVYLAKIGSEEGSTFKIIKE